MRICYDSTTATDIPQDAEMVAGYVDGRYAWSDADWALFPNAVKVRIAVFGATDDGVVGDVEQGCMTPGESLAWTRMRRAAGVDPTLYVNLANANEVRYLFERAGEPQPHYWLAHYDGVMTIPAGYVAKQYANADITGGHYDASSVVAHWPGVDKEEVVNDAPILDGQEATEQNARVGDAPILLQAFWTYPDGRKVKRERKVWSKVPLRKTYELYPQVDADADPTERLDAEPAIFVVTYSAL